MSIQDEQAGTTRLLVLRDDDAVSRCALQIVEETLRARRDALISLTTGRTPAGLYRLLRARCHSGQVDLTAARFVCSEEYAGVGPDDAISLFRWLRTDMLDPCGVAAGSCIRLAGEALDPAAECHRFDARIEQEGGLDLVVQSIGPNGHFGFNEPGSRRDAASRMVALAPSTVESNLVYWPAGTQLPAHGLTMGIRTTVRARHVLLLVSGARKAGALARALDGAIDEGVPASLLRLAPLLTVVTDEAGAQEIRTRRVGQWDVSRAAG